MILAAPGWRAVYAERDSGGSVALPIVAWLFRAEDDECKKIDHRSLDFFYVSGEVGVPPVRSRDGDGFLGILPPGQDHETFWQEEAERYFEAEQAAEDRRLEAARDA